MGAGAPRRRGFAEVALKEPKAESEGPGRRAGAEWLGSGRCACPFLLDGVATEVLLRGQIVVGAAAQGEVVDARRAPSRMRVLVVKLEPALLAAALAARIDIRAARFIALPDAAADFGGDVPSLFREFRRGVPSARPSKRRGLRRWPIAHG